MTDAVVRRRYAEIANVYIRMFGSTSHVDPEDLTFLERNLGHCEGTVLDAGCGPGHLTAYLKNLGVSAEGIDLIPAFISSARSNWPDLDFAVGSVHSLDAPDHSLDGILAWYSLIHCGPSELATVLNEFRGRYAMAEGSSLASSMATTSKPLTTRCRPPTAGLP